VNMRDDARNLVKVLALLAVALWATPASADEVVVKVGAAVVITLPRQPQRIAVEDETVASLTLLPDGRARVRGLRVGRTRIIGRDHAQVPIIVPVRVTG
jgi:Flp pilus assembly secretin CpaC